MKHLEQYSLLLLEGILTIEHQTLYFLLPKRLTVLKVTKEFEHRSETKYGLFRKVTEAVCCLCILWSVVCTLWYIVHCAILLAPSS